MEILSYGNTSPFRSLEMANCFRKNRRSYASFHNRKPDSTSVPGSYSSDDNLEVERELEYIRKIKKYILGHINYGLMEIMLRLQRFMRKHCDGMGNGGAVVESFGNTELPQRDACRVRDCVVPSWMERRSLG